MPSSVKPTACGATRRVVPLWTPVTAALVADRLLEDVEDHSMTTATRPVTLRSSSACIAWGASSSR